MRKNTTQRLKQYNNKSRKGFYVIIKTKQKEKKPVISTRKLPEYIAGYTQTTAKKRDKLINKYVKEHETKVKYKIVQLKQQPPQTTLAKPTIQRYKPIRQQKTSTIQKLIRKEYKPKTEVVHDLHNQMIQEENRLTKNILSNALKKTKGYVNYQKTVEHLQHNLQVTITFINKDNQELAHIIRTTGATPRTAAEDVKKILEELKTKEIGSENLKNAVRNARVPYQVEVLQHEKADTKVAKIKYEFTLSGSKNRK